MSPIKASNKTLLTVPDQRGPSIINIIRPNLSTGEKIKDTAASQDAAKQTKASNLIAAHSIMSKLDKSNAGETIVRVDHIYNGKMAVSHVGRNITSGISLKLPSHLDSPTVIVNNRSTGTFLPSHITTTNGVILPPGKLLDNQKAAACTTKRLSVLNTTQKSNISGTRASYVLTNASVNKRKVSFDGDETKENKSVSKDSVCQDNKNLNSNQNKSSPERTKMLREGMVDSSIANIKNLAKTTVKGSELPEMSKDSTLHDKVGMDKKTDKSKHRLETQLQGTRHYSDQHEQMKSNGVTGMEVENSSSKTQSIVCNICEGGNTKFLGHTAFKLHYDKHHYIHHCEICQLECFGSVGLHTHMIDNHVEKKVSSSQHEPVSPGTVLKSSPDDKNVNSTTSNIKSSLTSPQNSLPLQRTMKDIRYHQEVIPKNCNPKRYKTLHRCQECKYMTYHGQNLNRHIDSFHHKRSCSYCGVVCTGKKPLTDHLRLVHQVKISPDKFVERRSNDDGLNRYPSSETQKRITTTLLKRSKKWSTTNLNKMRPAGSMKNRAAWGMTLSSKSNRIDYNKLSAKKRLLKSLKKELNHSKDQRKKKELEKLLLSLPSMEDEVDNKSIYSKCPYCESVFAGKNSLCQHLVSEHGISLHFTSKSDSRPSSPEQEEENDKINEYDPESRFDLTTFNKRNILKRKRYSSESSHNGSTDDYDEEDGKCIDVDHQSTSSLYDNLFFEREYQTFNCDEKNIKNDLDTSSETNISMEKLMQQAFSNVMSVSASDTSSMFSLSDGDSNTISFMEDDISNTGDEAFIDNTTYAKCLPTNEDLAAWELFPKF